MPTEIIQGPRSVDPIGARWICEALAASHAIERQGASQACGDIGRCLCLLITDRSLVVAQAHRDPVGTAPGIDDRKFDETGALCRPDELAATLSGGDRTAVGKPREG